MSGRYRIPHLAPHSLHRTECLIKRSRFITSLAHSPDAASARAFVERIAREFPDATHNCWAFAAGAPGHTAAVGFSDDGEPHGTAGRPMLTVLLHSSVGEITAVVTRYFGGIKLGTGGLVRAYQSCVQECLESLPLHERIIPAYLDIVIEYPFVTPLQRLLPQFEACIEREEFGADASFRLRLPQEHVAAFTAALTNLTDGNALIEPCQA
jgi:uncharacterized YigZ family protein